MRRSSPEPAQDAHRELLTLRLNPPALPPILLPPMILRTLLTALLGLSCLGAQDQSSSPDKITLNNGDTLQGVIVGMADGEITFKSPALGEIKLKLANVTNILTAQPIVLVTKDGERIQRRVTGIQSGAMQLGEGPAGAPAIASLPLATLTLINPPTKPPAEWTGSLNFGGSIQQGNTEKRAATSDFTAVRRSEIDRFTALGWWEYSEEQDRTTYDWTISQRRLGMGLKYDYFLSKKAYTYVNTAGESDKLRDLDLRYTVGAGLGYQFVEEKDFKFGAEVGAGYFLEDYRSATPDDDYITLRGAYNLEKSITSTLKFLQTFVVFPSAENSDDVVLKLDTRLQANLSQSMIAQLKFVWDYDNTPAPAKERSDFGYYLTVGWSF